MLIFDHRMGHARPMTGTDTNFCFLSPEGQPLCAIDWLTVWRERYPSKKYPEGIYKYLLAKGPALDDRDAELLGAWKDGALMKAEGGSGACLGPFDGDFVQFNGRWGPSASSVAYEVWQKIHGDVAQLKSWLKAKNHDAFLEYLAAKVAGNKRFGLSRATYVLHIFSKARFPILDSNVCAALHQLLDGRYRDTTFPKKIASSCTYLSTFCPIIWDLEAECDTEAVPQRRRDLDKALFAYGRHLRKKDRNQ